MCLLTSLGMDRRSRQPFIRDLLKHAMKPRNSELLYYGSHRRCVDQIRECVYSREMVIPISTLRRWSAAQHPIQTSPLGEVEVNIIFGVKYLQRNFLVGISFSDHARGGARCSSDKLLSNLADQLQSNLRRIPNRCSTILVTCYDPLRSEDCHQLLKPMTRNWSICWNTDNIVHIEHW